MARIKCPHCGAGNRDSRETVTCWQCGKQMWEAADRQTYALKDAPNLAGTTALDPNAPLPGMAPDIAPARGQSGLLIPILITILCFIMFVAVVLWKLIPSSTVPQSGSSSASSPVQQPTSSSPQ